MKFLLFIRGVICKVGIEAKVGVEKSDCILVELTADKEAGVKVLTVKILEDMIDKLRKENVEHPVSYFHLVLGPRRVWRAVGIMPVRLLMSGSRPLAPPGSLT